MLSTSSWDCSMGLCLCFPTLDLCSYCYSWFLVSCICPHFTLCNLRVFLWFLYYLWIKMCVCVFLLRQCRPAWKVHSSVCSELRNSSTIFITTLITVNKSQLWNLTLNSQLNPHVKTCVLISGQILNKLFDHGHLDNVSPELLASSDAILTVNSFSAQNVLCQKRLIFQSLCLGYVNLWEHLWEL